MGNSPCLPKVEKLSLTQVKRLVICVFIQGNRGWNVACASFGAALAVCVAAKSAGAGEAAEIALHCAADANRMSEIILKQADMLCGAALAALRKLAAPENPPIALHLVIMRANDRSAAVRGAWVFVGGQERTIAPLQTSFFDTAASPALHDYFMRVFFETNPVPSAR
jgi:hypothetical protein